MHKRTSFTFPCTCGWINAFCASFWKHSYNAVYNKEWEDQNTIEVLLLLPRDLWKVFRHPQESTGHFHKHHEQFWRKKGNLMGVLDPGSADTWPFARPRMTPVEIVVWGEGTHETWVWARPDGLHLLLKHQHKHAQRSSTSSSGAKIYLKNNICYHFLSVFPAGVITAIFKWK